MKKEIEKLDIRLTEKTRQVMKDMSKETMNRLESHKEVEDWMSQQEELYKINMEAVKLQKLSMDKNNRKMFIFESVLSEFNIHIEALKTHCLATDLHLESTLPL